MAGLISSSIPEVGLRLLLSPLGGNVVTRTACCTVGIAFPVYSTFKAIEKKDRSEQERWLLYWAAYGSFSLVEVFSDKILSWFPFYYQAKFAFLVWLQLPFGNGAKHLYARHLRPFLLRHQNRLDKLHDLTTREITKFVIAHHGEIEYVKSALLKLATTATKGYKENIGRPREEARQQNLIDGPDGDGNVNHQNSTSSED